jgi:predicted component of type VI protein secretion system
VDFSFTPKAITIGVLADKDLNFTGSGPASLSLCLYQLSDPSWFEVNMKSSEGLASLNACPPKESQGSLPIRGLITAERRFFQPGQRADLIMDRQPGTKFIGVAGGYSSLPASGGAAYLPIPIRENKKLIRRDTFEAEELRAWLLLKSQFLSFFVKSESDYELLAEDFGPDGLYLGPKTRGPEPLAPTLPCVPKEACAAEPAKAGSAAEVPKVPQGPTGASP